MTLRQKESTSKKLSKLRGICLEKDYSIGQKKVMASQAGGTVCLVQFWLSRCISNE